MKKVLSAKNPRLRKNFLASFIIIIFLWLMIFGLVYFVDPNTFGATTAFFILLFFSVLFTASSLLTNKRRGLIAAAFCVVFLLFRYLGLGNLLNFLLLLGLSITSEIFFSRK